MKTKKLLKFYFTAEEVVGRLDRLIYKKASSADWVKSAEESAEEVAELIGKKTALRLFMDFLDKTMSAFDAGQREILKKYAFSGCAADTAADGLRREIHRLVVSFTRKISGKADRYADGLRVMCEFGIFD